VSYFKKEESKIKKMMFEDLDIADFRNKNLTILKSLDGEIDIGQKIVDTKYKSNLRSMAMT
jgi:hypothetical protein